MNDYDFGNLIYECRKKLNLSQSDLASFLDVSNKAISKWENGKSKPNIDTLKKLSALFNMSIEEMLKYKEKNKKNKITKIVITGGPCAGKTTAFSWIEKAFTRLGYSVIFIPETATELIPAGISPLTLETNKAFQEKLLKLQLAKEKIFEEAAYNLKNDKVLIVCDRGTMDSKAFINRIEFLQVLKELCTNEVELRDNYDAIFHLVTAAKGAKEFYTLENNKARSETIDEAIIQDDKLIEAWSGHPRFRIIDNSTNFEFKMKKLIKEITNLLGEPEPLEIERKYLIEYPDIKWLESNKNCKKIDIIQTYLTSQNNSERRIRQRGINGNYIYYETIKKTINDLKRVELERRLTKEEYLNLLMEIDINKKQIKKTRYCLIYKNKYLEIDIFPFWNDKAILEVELNDENEKVEIPKQLKLIKEVTNDPKYKNYNLAN